MKLLIADDNLALRALVRQFCASVASEMRDCKNGAEAVEIFEEFHPDWTLMDLMMPEMDGLTATAKIKARHPEARVVIVTQLRGPEYREAALQAGACAFLFKDDLQSLPKIISRNSPP
jgi:CheY-like chemotaxis protein